MKTIPTWEDGTPRSMRGPFDVLYSVPVPKPELTLGQMYAERERLKAKARRDAKKMYLAAVPLHSLSGKTKAKAKTRTTKVLRNNVGSAFCYPIGTQADAGKTARIQGRSL